jgi:hypothetical protein
MTTGETKNPVERWSEGRYPRGSGERKNMVQKECLLEDRKDGKGYIISQCSING